MQVLIVEDNVDIGWALSQLIRGLGHTVVRCETPQSTLEAITSYRPDLVLLDIELPEIDGYKLATLLRKRGLSDATILAISAQDDNPGKRHEATIDGHYVKPLGLSQIEQILARRCSAAQADM
jgi:CheY-like chemotaxis protein